MSEIQNLQKGSVSTSCLKMNLQLFFLAIADSAAAVKVAPRDRDGVVVCA